MHKPQEFYEKLAYLFYSVAGIDGKVDSIEIKKLHEEVISIWSQTDNDSHEFGTNGGVEIEAIFEWLEEEGYDSRDAWNDFKDYAKNNAYLFDQKMRNHILHTCTEIASIYYHINKNEEELINKLKSFLSKL
ncbi:MAG: TerB family tellurite resistance protein [Saprospiraceae bacterium]|nr:TerB family tellurite resistance protein [Saprospiraceae bacterium]MBK7810539.1 TerB family tellurite resistance protein [Saprospiraceae bacterium]MBK9630128.1 TerB family tellurite resistance protein [Saprospiraceae bacterium]